MYHSHCLFCDGRADMEVFVRFAISRGFASYGFSSHAPLPFSTGWSMEWDRVGDYLGEFARLKERYAGRIELAVGLEIDYLDEHSNPASPCYQALPLDYRIGSVHMLRTPTGEWVDLDAPADTYRRRVDACFDGDVEGVVREYFRRSFRLLEGGGFDILGHADKMHYNASCCRPGLLDEPWYDRLVHGYLAEAVNRGYIIEINTKSFRELGVFYPDVRYFPFLRSMDARVQVNSDAHYPDRVDAGCAEALAALRKAGFEHVWAWHGGMWVETEIGHAGTQKRP